MVYTYVYFTIRFYGKELLVFSHSKLNVYILMHYGSYIIYITIFFIYFAYLFIPL